MDIKEAQEVVGETMKVINHLKLEIRQLVSNEIKDRIANDAEIRKLEDHRSALRSQVDRLNLDVQQLQSKLNEAEDAFMDIYDHSSEEYSSKIAKRMLKEFGRLEDEKEHKE